MMACSSASEDGGVCGSASSSTTCLSSIKSCSSSQGIPSSSTSSSTCSQTCCPSGVAQCVLAVLENLPCEPTARRPHSGTPYPTSALLAQYEEDTEHDNDKPLKKDNDNLLTNLDNRSKECDNDSLHGSDYHLYEEIIYENNNNSKLPNKTKNLSNSPPPLPARPPHLLKPASYHSLNINPQQQQHFHHLLNQQKYPFLYRPTHNPRLHYIPVHLQKCPGSVNATVGGKELSTFEQVQNIFQRHLPAQQNNPDQQKQQQSHSQNASDALNSKLDSQHTCQNQQKDAQNDNFKSPNPPMPPVRTTSVIQSNQNTGKSTSLSCLVLSNPRASISPPNQTASNTSLPSKLPPPPPKPPKPPRINYQSAAQKVINTQSDSESTSTETKTQSKTTKESLNKAAESCTKVLKDQKNLKENNCQREINVSSTNTNNGNSNSNNSSSSSKPKQRSNLYSIFKERQHRRFLSASLELEYHKHTDLTSQQKEKDLKDTEQQQKQITEQYSQKKLLTNLKLGKHQPISSDSTPAALSGCSTSAALLNSPADDDYGFKVLPHVV